MNFGGYVDDRDEDMKKDADDMERMIDGVLHNPIQAKRALLARLETLNLPPTPLDHLIDELGGKGADLFLCPQPRGQDCVRGARAGRRRLDREPQNHPPPPAPRAREIVCCSPHLSQFRHCDLAEFVAEMTGRRGRLVRNRAGKIVYEVRGQADGDSIENLNIKETKRFNAGSKLVAIISDAASTGISLHAATRVANRRCVCFSALDVCILLARTTGDEYARPVPSFFAWLFYGAPSTGISLHAATRVINRCVCSPRSLCCWHFKCLRSQVVREILPWSQNASVWR